MELDGLDVAVVGGSLGGLSVAAALARAGANITVLERGTAGFESRGAGLGISLPLLQALAPAPEVRHVVHNSRQVEADGAVQRGATHLTVTSYGLLWQWLRARVVDGVVQHGVTVTRVDASGAVETAQGQRSFDLVVVADGGGSALRGVVDDAPREYAGYVLWRGLVSPRKLDAAGAQLADRFSIAAAPGQHVVAYGIPDHTQPQARAINWGWYVPSPPGHVARSELHALDHGGVHRVGLDNMLATHAGALPAWVGRLARATLQHGMVAPHPVMERAARAMAAGRVVVLGDAAHQASPITGGGARMAMEDALCLVRCLKDAKGVEEALAAVQRARVPETAAVVEQGRAWGQALCAAARGQRR